MIKQEERVLCSTLLQQGTKLFIVSQANATMINLADGSVMGSKALTEGGVEVTTCVKAFDQLPDTFFFGITNEQQNQFAFKIWTQTSCFYTQNAH